MFKIQSYYILFSRMRNRKLGARNRFQEEFDEEEAARTRAGGRTSRPLGQVPLDLALVAQEDVLDPVELVLPALAAVKAHGHAGLDPALLP